MIKVLFATHTYYPDNNGVQVVTQYIAEGLVGKGYNVSVIAPCNANCGIKNHNSVDIYHVKIEGRKHHVFRGDREKYERLVKELNPDVFVVVCVQSWTFDWANKFLDELNCAKILHTHGFFDYQKKYGFLKSLFNEGLHKAGGNFLSYCYYSVCPKYIKKYDVVTYLSPNESSYQYAVDKGLLDNAEILGNAVEDAFWEINVAHNPGPDLVILNVANYCENKNQKKLVEAFYQLPDKNQKLILVGGEKNVYYNELVQFKQESDKKYGMRQVQIYTGKTREEIVSLYSKADIYVSLSKREAFSISLCEAAACGIPIISYAVGNALDFDGIVIAEEDNITSKIQMLIDNPALRLKNGNALKQYAKENFRRENKVQWYDTKIKELLNK